MAEVTDPPDQLFVVRVWFEASGIRGGAWRGSVTHVASQASYYFTEVAELADYVKLRLSSVMQIDSVKEN